MPTVRSNDLPSGRTADRAAAPPPAVVTPPPASRRVKHALDRVVAAGGMLVTAPLFAAIALALRRRGGPVLSREPRLGEYGRTIELLSFAVTPEMRRGRGWRLLTGLGITALPQLWNVLRGDLSLVGPRPRALGADPPPARPGLTGLAQLEALKRPPAERERLRLDAEYAAHWSLGLDARILLRTLWRVVR